MLLPRLCRVLLPEPVSAVVTINCGAEKKSFTIVVEGIANYVPVEKIRVDGATEIYEMLIGETVQLSARVAPDEASLHWVRWESGVGEKAAYEDFLGRWTVTGTEHEWFGRNLFIE